MKKLMFILIMSLPILLFAKDRSVYENAYREAIKDSVISSSEKNILETISISTNLNEDDIIAIKRKVENPKDSKYNLSRDGRLDFIGLSMYYGMFEYGYNIPYVLGIDKTNIMIGIELLAAPTSFYLAWKYTENMDLPQGRANFLYGGTYIGKASSFILPALVGFNNWENFDEKGKIFRTTSMLLTPAGTYFGNKLYKKWKPTDGQALAITNKLFLGAYNGFTIHSLLSKNPENLEYSDNFMRGRVFSIFGSALFEGYLSYKYLFKDEQITEGDAYFNGLGASYGFFSSLAYADLLGVDGYKEIIASLAIGTNLGYYSFNAFNKGKDLTIKETGIIGLGGFSGVGFTAGLGFLLDIDEVNYFKTVCPIGLIGGAIIAYKMIDPSNENENSYSRVKTNFMPSVNIVNNEFVYGANLNISF
ncbi:MAG: hypothetical protein U9R41_05195 [Candidatus Marinimicrobia bacterium]|nr:hypothetical protein [Candidatus Neomarinimicrobiota bacterium]